MVSAKCTRHESRSSTFASAAATPPSAITVCALPRSDFDTTPTETPAADASMAARSPAPPAPTTSTSYDAVRGSPLTRASGSAESGSQDPPVVPDPHGAQPHVDVAEPDRHQAAPGEQLVPAVEAGDAVVGRDASGGRL